MNAGAGDPAAVALSVDHLFRRRAGQMVATLVRIFGFDRLALVEDVVQDAMVQALRQWPYRGVPDNPSAWIVQVAKNRALDQLRRETNWSSKRELLARQVERLPVALADDVTFARELHDDQLRLVFACCHPALRRDAQVALTLQLAGGFGAAEAARAFLVRPRAMAQRLVRAKRTLRQERVPLELPPAPELPARLDAVLEVLYLVFNEGHGAHSGDDLVKLDLCREAIRLVLLVCDHPVIAAPKADALAALMLFQGARLATRTDPEGDLLLLAEQDRSLWDRSMLRQAAQLLARSATGDEVSTYHLEAEIAACHALAPDYDGTDWRRILECYDALQRRNPSPVVAVHRLVALAQVAGPAAALAEAGEVEADPTLHSYYPAHVVIGELRAGAGDHSGGRRAIQRALELVASAPVRRHLERRLTTLDGPRPR
jgi:RNA polymerase sigma-70 factor (ECF subfamily)